MLGFQAAKVVVAVAFLAFVYASKGKEARWQIDLAFRFGKDHDHFHHAEFILAAESR